MESLIHKYLDCIRAYRPQMHGKGNNEHEWFYGNAELIKCAINCIIDCHDCNDDSGSYYVGQNSVLLDDPMIE
jgi:hypothetical protein